jgi:hypothetical protein
VHDIWECKTNNPLLPYDPACKAGPDEDSPVQALVTKSNNVDAAAGAKTRSDVEALVHATLKQVVINRSALWDPQHLDVNAGSKFNVLETREVMTKPILENTLEPYTLKYLLANNLFMISFYHHNRVANCLKILDEYSPETIINVAADRILQQTPSAYDQFLAAMVKINDQCLEHSIHPELTELKKEIIGLMD